jgi:hypothetical protein
MKIHLNQQEIEAAILLYVGNQGITLVGQQTTIEMTAGRGPNGMSATVDISNAEAKVQLHAVPVTTKPEECHQESLPFAVAAEEPVPAEETPDTDKPLFGN